MKNMEQIRARNALKCPTASGAKGGELIKKIPPLVMNHGLLATAASAYEDLAKNEHKKQGWGTVFDHIAIHLADKEIGILKPENDNLEKMMGELTNGDSNQLRKATNETMAWLTYARRFVKKG